MDYEKLYKEALKRAKITLDCCDSASIVTKNTVYNIFPELAESEDEKVRKTLIRVLNENIGNGIEKYGAKLEDALTWLEKQDKKTSWKPTKEEMDVLYGLAYITNQYDERKEEVITRLYQDLKREFFNGSSYENMFSSDAVEDDVRRRSTIQVLEYARSLDAYNQYGKADIDKNIAWLEKQVPIDKEKVLIGARKDIALSIMNYLDNNSVGMCLSNMECKDLEDAVVDSDWSKVYNYMKKKLEEQGEQKVSIVDFKAKDWYVSKVDGKIRNIYHSVDAVEPKFKVGDWVINESHDICLITDIDLENGYYICESNRFGNTEGDIDLTDKKFHLWTIQDAKDGDVLVNGSNIFMFHFINDTRLMGYCHVNTDNGRFYDDTGKNECFCLIDAVVNPATKEQCDLLFQKMGEALYEWDAEKKELKKIEDEIEIPFGAKDSELQEVSYYIPEGFHAEIDDDKVVIKKGEKPTEWGGDDERMCQETIDWFEKKCFPYALEYENPARESIRWLKSLKNRVIPQPKQEWTEEDEMLTLSIEQVMNCASLLNIVPEKIDKIKSWLKSIKQRIGG